MASNQFTQLAKIDGAPDSSSFYIQSFPSNPKDSNAAKENDESQNTHVVVVVAVELFGADVIARKNNIKEALTKELDRTDGVFTPEQRLQNAVRIVNEQVYRARRPDLDQGASLIMAVVPHTQQSTPTSTIVKMVGVGVCAAWVIREDTGRQEKIFDLRSSRYLGTRYSIPLHNLTTPKKPVKLVSNSRLVLVAGTTTHQLPAALKDATARRLRSMVLQNGRGVVAILDWNRQKKKRRTRRKTFFTVLAAILLLFLVWNYWDIFLPSTRERELHVVRTKITEEAMLAGAQTSVAETATKQADETRIAIAMASETALSEIAAVTETTVNRQTTIAETAEARVQMQTRMGQTFSTTAAQTATARAQIPPTTIRQNTPIPTNTPVPPTVTPTPLPTLPTTVPPTASPSLVENSDVPTSTEVLPPETIGTGDANETIATPLIFGEPNMQQGGSYTFGWEWRGALENVQYFQIDVQQTQPNGQRQVFQVDSSSVQRNGVQYTISRRLSLPGGNYQWTVVIASSTGALSPPSSPLALNIDSTGESESPTEVPPDMPTPIPPSPTPADITNPPPQDVPGSPT